ncbi:hypothetical protein DFQ26_001265 [Actinomortierella ambigua]|nr:hypothetical protein DFQ26_001265 [Actinomortierella ambigua]
MTQSAELSEISEVGESNTIISNEPAFGGSCLGVIDDPRQQGGHLGYGQKASVEFKGEAVTARGPSPRGVVDLCPDGSGLDGVRQLGLNFIGERSVIGDDAHHARGMVLDVAIGVLRGVKCRLVASRHVQLAVHRVGESVGDGVQ